MMNPFRSQKYCDSHSRGTPNRDWKFHIAENSTCFHLDSWQVFGMLSFTSALASFLSQKMGREISTVKPRAVGCLKNDACWIKKSLWIAPKILPRIPCPCLIDFLLLKLDGCSRLFYRAVPGVCTVILASFLQCKEWRSRPQGIAICGFVLCGRRSVPWVLKMLRENGVGRL